MRIYLHSWPAKLQHQRATLSQKLRRTTKRSAPTEIIWRQVLSQECHRFARSDHSRHASINSSLCLSVCFFLSLFYPSLFYLALSILSHFLSSNLSLSFSFFYLCKLTFLIVFINFSTWVFFTPTRSFFSLFLFVLSLCFVLISFLLYIFSWFNSALVNLFLSLSDYFIALLPSLGMSFC